MSEYTEYILENDNEPLFRDRTAKLLVKLSNGETHAVITDTVFTYSENNGYEVKYIENENSFTIVDNGKEIENQDLSLDIQEVLDILEVDV